MSKIISIKPDETVGYKGNNYKITQIIDFESVIAVDLRNGVIQRLLIQDITSPHAEKEEIRNTEPDLAVVSDSDWQIAQFRYSIIRPLLESGRRTTEEVGKQAIKAEVHISTVYRWIEAFESLGLVSALMPSEKSGGRGKSRLQPEIEAIINATIEDFYLDKRRPSVQKTCTEVIQRCRKANLPSPHPNTIRNRINIISEKVKLQRRISSKAAAQKYEPMVGTFPGADWPFAVVQVDHTKLDIILVDDLDRMPVGRPWITLAIDVFSRMVAGMYISFDPPGALSVGLCIAHAILPKEKWLSKHDVATPWPVWGVMNIIHADNAKEFRGDMLKKACLQYGMELNWRPVAKPRYGAHIERLLGTFNEEIHSLPGTTFSNIQEKGEYDSDKNSAMTLTEFETWLANYITGVYHQREHKGIGTSPIKKYEEGIFGGQRRPGCGLPPKIMDEERLRLDLMPFVERTVQSYGILIDEIHYYHNVLSPWINARDPDNRKKKRQFLLRRDSRDISVVYFYDPEVNTYYEIPYRDSSRPAISLWELRAVKKKIEEEGRADIDENLIFETYDRMRSIEDNSVKITKKMRRDKQRRNIHREIAKQNTVNLDLPIIEEPRDKILPFDEIEEY